MTADLHPIEGALRRMARPGPVDPAAGDDRPYTLYGRRLAPWVSALTFVAGWGFVILREGPLLGAAIGWLPAGMIALLAGQLIVWLWGPIAVALLVTGMAFLITLAVGKVAFRDTTTADAEALSLALDATYPQQAADADAQRRTLAAQDRPAPPELRPPQALATFPPLLRSSLESPDTPAAPR
jgi:hypothetical protein